MKRLVLVLLVTCLVCCGMTQSEAERLKGSGKENVYLHINYDTSYGKSTRTECDNGLVVDYTDLVKCYAYNPINYDNPNSFYFKAGVLGYPYTIGVQAVIVDLTNTTDKVMVVKWAESSLSLGDFYGIPFLPHMKYTDYGNPSATPDTIVPPHKTVTQTLYVSVSWSGKEWVQNYCYVRRDESLKAAVYMKVLDPAGNSTYCTAESPPIGIPQHILAPFRKRE